MPDTHLLHTRDQRGRLESQEFRRAAGAVDLAMGVFEDCQDVVPLALLELILRDESARYQWRVLGHRWTPLLRSRFRQEVIEL